MRLEPMFCVERFSKALCWHCSVQDKENQEDAPEHQEDIEANELPETSFQVGILWITTGMEILTLIWLGFVQDVENAGQAAKEPIRESVCPTRLHRYDLILLDVIIDSWYVKWLLTALLHLCNEQNLALESTGEEFKDFLITRPSWKQF